MVNCRDEVKACRGTRVLGDDSKYHGFQGFSGDINMFFSCSPSPTLPPSSFLLLLSSFLLLHEMDYNSTRVCGNIFTVDHTMICQQGWFVTQCHNEPRDFTADLLSIVCSDVQIKPILQDISEEQLGRGSNRAPDARLDIHARGFWENQRSAFFDVRVFHPNADSYRDLELQQIYCNHENEKKRLYIYGINFTQKCRI